MPVNKRLTIMPKFCMGLLVMLTIALASSSLNARDQVEYGRYLGVRLQMWEESYDVLDKIMKSGKADEVSRAKRAKAEVMKAEADAIYALDQDEGARKDRYEKAVDVFGEPTDPAGVLSKGVMLLDLALALRRTDEKKARDFCESARVALDAQRLALGDERDRVGDDAFEPKAGVYNAIFYHMCRSFYVKGMTYESGSGDRESSFRESEKWLDEFDFLRAGTTEEFVLTYELRGDIELARSNPAGAASKYIDLVNFVSGFGSNYETGRLALEHGYLRAAELLTGELDYDPKNLEKCADLFAEAQTKYGAISDLEFFFKRFQLFRISALIKLGDEAKIKGAIDLLFKLADDRDPSFRRQALMVLGDIATRDNLDNELRFRCANTVYSGIDANPIYSLMLKNIQAYQSLLMACKDMKLFETFGPACFVRIGDLYSGMHRFLDATLVYKEATYRTAYFVEKFPVGGAVPDHMKDRCDLITDGKSLNEFAGKMAEQYARHAGFLIHKQYGEPNNKYFKKLSDDANQLKASFSGEQAKMDLAFQGAKAMYDKKNYHPAAVRLVNLPARYKSFQIALYIGAKAYSYVSEDTNGLRSNRRGENKPEEFVRDVEDPDWYTEQRNRHSADLDKLPAALIAGLEKNHFDAISSPDTPDQLVNWHKAAYYYKKYFLFEAQKAWEEVGPLMEGIENPGIADAIGAIAQARNTRWMRDNPSGQGEPDADMKRIGYAAYELAFLLRNPPKSTPEELRKAVLANERDLALGILRPYWKWFGTHLADSQNYKQGALRLSFGALAESDDAEACETVYRAYLEAFPNDTEQVKYMVGVVYTKLRDVLTPKTNSMALASSVLISRSNLMKKNSFERINGAAKDDKGVAIPGFAEDEKRFNEAKGTHAKRLVLAEHFWKRWMLELFLDAEKNAELRANLPELKDSVTRKWDAMAAEYPKRWADAVRAEYDTQMKKDNFKGIKDDLAKAISSGTDYDIVDKIKAAQDAEAAKKEADGSKVGLYNDLLMFITLATDELAYFTGTIFVYDFGGFLEELARDVDERARPSTTRVLNYYEEYRVRRGDGGPDTLKENDVLLLGNQFFRIRDWRNTVKYLTNYATRFGGERPWGKEDSIPVDQRTKMVGKAASATELLVKYQLGKAHLELYKESRDIKDLTQAALYMRRCWSFNLLRDTNKKLNDAYKLSFQKELEDNYIYISNAMAEIFLMMHEATEVKVSWPQYQDQSTKTLEQSKENPLQDVPKDKAGYLWEAAQIHLKVWVQFRLLGRYQFRSDFRDNLEAWLKLMIRWLETYNKEDKGIEKLKGEGVAREFKDAFNFATTEGNFAPTYLPAPIVDYLNRLKTYAKQIDALCTKHKIAIK